jgi:hexosaminidase
MLLPRLQAEAEVGFSQKDNKDFEDFEKRLAVDYQRMKKQGGSYRDHRK